MNAQKILIVGQEQSVVGKVTTSLNNMGYHATGTTADTALPKELMNTHFDLVAFACAVKSDVKYRFENILKRNNPGLLSVTRMYPSVPVLVDQVNMALNRKYAQHAPVSGINYDINEGCLSVDMEALATCHAQISLYSIGFFNGTTQQQLFSAQLLPGKRFIKFKQKALAGFGTKFLLIRINKQVFYMQRL